MPWPWPIATACLDLSGGQVLNWPLRNKNFQENEYLLDACWRVWRVFHLFYKPRTVGKKSNWTGADVDLFAFLTDEAWEGWTQHLNDGKRA